MIRQEEDDMTQEIRALVVFAVSGEIAKLTQKILELRVQSTNEFEDGFNTGLSLAVKTLRKDKSVE